MTEIRVEHGDIQAVAADTCVVNLFEGVKRPGGGTGAVDRALGGAISDAIAAGDITGKWGELRVIYTLGRIPARRVLVAGLGKSREFTLDRVRDLAANVARELRRLGGPPQADATTIVHGAGIAQLPTEGCAEAIAEGTLLGLYRFTAHRKPKNDEHQLAVLTIVERDAAKLDGVRRGVERGRVIAEAQNFARDLANEPANVLTPTELARRAGEACQAVGVAFEAYDRGWMETKLMGSLLGVAAGSHQPPVVIVIEYRGDPDSPRVTGLVGKGITFDTGGISIKPAENMQEMKGDMAGGGAVIATLVALGRLKPRINVIGIVPATENMPGGAATRPGDVLRAMDGTTIEVINTDAEGRLILADGLCYARERGCSPILDVATLTGAVSVALGDLAFGLMSNHEGTLEAVRGAAEAAGERCWPLPMWSEYAEQLKSEVADLKNTGGRRAAAITAAHFLKHFAGDTPWVHLDIAGVDTYDRESGITVKGASGIPVRTLIEFLTR